MPCLQRAVQPRSGLPRHRYWHPRFSPRTGYCPAIPPAPWHMGIPPKGIDVRFMSPMVRESFFGLISAENRSFASREVARIALVIVRMAWGRIRSWSATITSDAEGIAIREKDRVVIGGKPWMRMPAASATTMTTIDERSGMRNR